SSCCSLWLCCPRSLHSLPTRRSSDLPALFLCCRVISQRTRNRCRHRDNTNRAKQGLHAMSHLTFKLGSQHFRPPRGRVGLCQPLDRKSTRLNSSHQIISYAVFCLKKK